MIPAKWLNSSRAFLYTSLLNSITWSKGAQKLTQTQSSNSGFLEFCKKLEGCTQSLIDCIKFFIWADGTTDGTGKIKDRMNKIVWKKKYPKKLSEIKKFFLRNKIQIIEKVLFEGRKNNINYTDLVSPPFLIISSYSIDFSKIGLDKNLSFNNYLRNNLIKNILSKL